LHEHLVGERVLMDLILRVARDGGASSVRPQLDLAALHIAERGLKWGEHRRAAEHAGHRRRVPSTGHSMPSMSPDLIPVLLCIFVGAALYTSVGHGGATVYTAILTLFGFAIAPLV